MARPLRLSDLEIPYEAVIAGLRRRVYDHLPATLRSFTRSERSSARFSKRLAERMLLLGTIVSPNVVRALVLGRDVETRVLRVANAVGLSTAIPALLPYEPPSRGAPSDAILAHLREEHEVALFVDGGIVANVPARIEPTLSPVRPAAAAAGFRPGVPVGLGAGLVSPSERRVRKP